MDAQHKPCTLRFARFPSFQRQTNEQIPLIQSCIAECGIKASRFVLNLVDHGQSQVQLELSSRTPAKGETLAVLVTLPPPRDFFQKLNLSFREMVWGSSLVSVSVGGVQFPVYPFTGRKNVWRALIPTSPLDVPGARALTVNVRDGRHKVYHGDVHVADKEYPVESIWLSDEKACIRGGTTEEKVAVQTFRQIKTPLQLWSGAFKLPTEGDVTTGYGLQRYYNGVFAKDYYHQGVDYGAEEGTPVTAPANGRVVLVGKEADGFQLHGNCVGLDHGQGVTSIFMHLSSVTAVEGEIVKQGQVVGTVGETGLATGPHLHWGLHVNDTAVDPNLWLEKYWWM